VTIDNGGGGGSTVPDIGQLDVCLAVADVVASMEFYRDLGFSQVGGEIGEGWTIMAHGAARLGLYEGHIGEMMLNFRGGDVFAIAESLEALGYALESAAVREPDGTDGATIRDPDGHLIYFNTP
jgi:catechol 2,3-dioxygenase-like lactoylglutathione lyase family enzyme